MLHWKTTRLKCFFDVTLSGTNIFINTSYVISCHFIGSIFSRSRNIVFHNAPIENQLNFDKRVPSSLNRLNIFLEKKKDRRMFAKKKFVLTPFGSHQMGVKGFQFYRNPFEIPHINRYKISERVLLYRRQVEEPYNGTNQVTLIKGEPKIGQNCICHLPIGQHLIDKGEKGLLTPDTHLCFSRSAYRMYATKQKILVKGWKQETW